METITDLIKGVSVPRMEKIREVFDDTHIPVNMIADMVNAELSREALGGQVKPGMRIAITCGSRGMSNNAVMAKAIVDFVKSKDAEPYIVPAMGSHGGATAEGQLQILKDYGITEEAMGCPIKSSMDTVQIGLSGVRHQPVFMDKNASEADGIILFNRIKPHTSFRGPYESGLMKMMAIGLGKQKGAESIHHQSPAIMHELIEEYGRTFIDNVPIIRKEMESFLRVMLYIKKPKRILELGTAVGYSAILMSECIDEDGKITTIENYEKRIVEAKKNIELSGKGQIIELLEGDATEVMKTLPSQQFDFVFMDAAKAQYIYFLPEVLRLMKKGAVLITDNVLQEGDLIESRFVVERRDRTIHKRMREYLEVVKNHEELETSIVPIGDGITISVKK